MKISKMTDAELAAEARAGVFESEFRLTDLLHELADRLSPDETKAIGVPMHLSGDEDADEAMKRGLADILDQ